MNYKEYLKEAESVDTFQKARPLFAKLIDSFVKTGKSASKSDSISTLANSINEPNVTVYTGKKAQNMSITGYGKQTPKSLLNHPNYPSQDTNNEMMIVEFEHIRPSADRGVWPAFDFRKIEETGKYMFWINPILHNLFTDILINYTFDQFNITANNLNNLIKKLSEILTQIASATSAKSATKKAGAKGLEDEITPLLKVPSGQKWVLAVNPLNAELLDKPRLTPEDEPDSNLRYINDAKVLLRVRIKGKSAQDIANVINPWMLYYDESLKRGVLTVKVSKKNWA